MSLYAIADLHLSTAVHKPMDIFGSTWSNHENKIIQNWCLNHNDTIVIAGDISWAMNFQELQPDLELLDRLPGKKILLKGNHDYWWNTQKKLNDFTSERFPTISFLYNNTYELEKIYICGTRGWLLEPGKENDEKIINREAERLKLSLNAYINKTSQKPAYVFLHYPPIFNGTVCTQIMDILQQYNVCQCFYGHLHGPTAHKLAEKGTVNGIQMHLISSDYLQFQPLKIL